MEDINVSDYLFKFKYNPLKELYEKAISSYWLPNEIKYEADISDWRNKLTDKERDHLTYILSFFAIADGMVNFNLSSFKEIFNFDDTNIFYDFQAAIENIHAETYTKHLNTLLDVDAKTLVLSEPIKKILNRKISWINKWLLSKDSNRLDRLIAFAAVEGIFFTSSFASIYYFKNKGLLFGLSQSNELISRDEALHTKFACTLFNILKTEEPYSEENIRTIIKEAIEIEQDFYSHISPPDDLLPKMKDYIHFMGNYILNDIGLTLIEPQIENPLDFMKVISLPGKTSFFERPVTEYNINIDNNNLFDWANCED